MGVTSELRHRLPWIEQLTREVSEAVGHVDILVNNAGINIRGNIGDISEADWDAVMDANLKAPFLVARAFGPAMCEKGWGRVITLSSMLGTIALPGRSPYASSKAAVLGLTRVLALEWAAAGVTVNAICPGPFGTEMNRQLLNDPEKYQAFVQKLPVGRWGDLHEIKGIAVFLCVGRVVFHDRHRTRARRRLDGPMSDARRFRMSNVEFHAHRSPCASHAACVAAWRGARLRAARCHRVPGSDRRRRTCRATRRTSSRSRRPIARRRHRRARSSSSAAASSGSGPTWPHTWRRCRCSIAPSVALGLPNKCTTGPHRPAVQASRDRRTTAAATT